MKRILLTVVLVGLLAGQASAGMYTLDYATATQLRQLNVPTQQNKLQLVIGTPGTVLSPVYFTNGDIPAPEFYGEVMQMDVGFVGYLQIGQVIQIGLNKPAIAGFDSLGAGIANDDDDPWTVQLFATDAGGTHTSGWVTLSGYSPVTGPRATFLTVPSVDFSTLSSLGFEVSGTRPQDVFHISVVPVPAALLLGLLGMTAAGLKLRRFA